VSLGIVCLILGGAYIWASRYIDAIRLNNIRNGYLSAYAGCPVTRTSIERYSLNQVNKYWNIDSQESHFTHADVVEYMMKNCPPKSDAQIEAAYAYLLDGTDRYPDMDEQRVGLKRIEGAKFERDYQLKFINKDLDIFRQ
jgi:hypothetical protein